MSKELLMELGHAMNFCMEKIEEMNSALKHLKNVCDIVERENKELRNKLKRKHENRRCKMGPEDHQVVD